MQQPKAEAKLARFSNPTCRGPACLVEGVASGGLHPLARPAQRGVAVAAAGAEPEFQGASN